MADSGGNSYIPLRVKITMFIIINILGLSFLVAGNFFTNDPPLPFQSFGTGFGPAWLSGVDLSWEGSDLTFEMYSKYRRYLAMAGEEAGGEGSGECQSVSQCGEGALCRDGVCVCDGGADERYVQLWGRCKSNHSQFLYVDNADYKWRKPQAPVIPEYCYHMVREKDGGKTVTKSKMVRKLDPAKQKTNSECVPVVYPDTFSLEDKTCTETECSDWDINSVCGEAGHCTCRDHMLWNKETLQCDLHLDLDCTNYLLYDFPDQLDIEIYEALRAEGNIKKTYDQGRLNKAFCIYLDGKVDEYNLHRQKFPYVWSKAGYLLPAFIFFGFGGFFYICGVLPMLCLYVKNEIHYCNPANAMREITGQN